MSGCIRVILAVPPKPLGDDKSGEIWTSQDSDPRAAPRRYLKYLSDSHPIGACKRMRAERGNWTRTGAPGDGSMIPRPPFLISQNHRAQAGRKK
jgi:hypothetical protein